MEKEYKILKTTINRIVTKEPFWAQMLCALKIEIIPGNQIHVYKLRVEIGQEIILKYSQEDKNKLITDELETVVLASLLKIAFLHAIRGKNKIAPLWNMACNIYISFLLARTGYKLPKEVEPILKEFCLNTQTEEQIYEILAQNAKDLTHTAQIMNKLMGELRSRSGNKDEKDEDLDKNLMQDKDKSNSQNNNKDGFQKSNKNKSDEEINSVEEIMQNDIMKDDDEDLEIIIRQFLLLGRKAGNVPAYFQEKIEALRKTNFNLHAILQEFVAKSLEPIRYNWQRPNRRYLASNNYLPIVNKENISGVVVAFDTSGSCYNEIKKILGIIYQIKELYEENEEPIHLLYCDCGEVHHQVWHNKQDLPELIGGGGTSYAPVMKWLRKKKSENLEEIKVLLYLTDGECDEFGLNPEIPIIWLVLDIYNSAKEFSPPFGKKVVVTKEQLKSIST